MVKMMNSKNILNSLRYLSVSRLMTIFKKIYKLLLAALLSQGGATASSHHMLDLAVFTLDDRPDVTLKAMCVSIYFVYIYIFLHSVTCLIYPVVKR